MKTNETNKHCIYFAVNKDRQLKEVLIYTSLNYGGYSLTLMQGGWINGSTGVLEEEPSYKMEIITDKTETEVLKLCKYIKKKCEQLEVYHHIEKIKLNVC